VVAHPAGAGRAREQGGARVEDQDERDDEQREAGERDVEPAGEVEAGEGRDQRQCDADIASVLRRRLKRTR
jgi:hypothetical protein